MRNAALCRRAPTRAGISGSSFPRFPSEIPGELWKFAEDVVTFAKRQYGLEASPKIILPLCDHMAGSIERCHSGIHLTNPMLWDVKRVYPNAKTVYFENVVPNGLPLSGEISRAAGTGAAMGNAEARPGPFPNLLSDFWGYVHEHDENSVCLPRQYMLIAPFFLYLLAFRQSKNHHNSICNSKNTIKVDTTQSGAAAKQKSAAAPCFASDAFIPG